jgi:hypothetical protein
MRNAAILAAFFLAGCAAGWEPRDTSWRANRVELHYVAQPWLFCKLAKPGDSACTVRINETKVALVYIDETLQGATLDCVIDHELRGHAMGRNHPRDAPYMCGPAL